MDSQWLNTQFRLNPEKTKAGLAKALNLDAPAISKILAGTRQIKAHEYIGMRKFFGLPVDGEYAASGDRTKSYVLAPLSEDEEQEKKHTGQALYDAPAPEDNWVMPASLFKSRTVAGPEQIRIFSVQENAMAPDFMPGEPVLVDLSDTKPSPPGVFLVSDGMAHIIRQISYVPHSDPPEIKLSAASPKYEPYTLSLKRTKIIGRVIAKLQWL